MLIQRNTLLDRWVCYNVLLIVVIFRLINSTLNISNKKKNIGTTSRHPLWFVKALFMCPSHMSEETYLLSLKLPTLMFVSRGAVSHLDICTAVWCAVGRDTRIWMRVIYAPILREHNVILGIKHLYLIFTAVYCTFKITWADSHLWTPIWCRELWEHHLEDNASFLCASFHPEPRHRAQSPS